MHRGWIVFLVCFFGMMVIAALHDIQDLRGNRPNEWVPPTEDKLQSMNRLRNYRQYR